jgi:Tol biopolymer transport system component
MDAHHIEATLRHELREILDPEHGPHPVWADSPASGRVAEHQRSRWPLRAIAAAAAVLVVAVVGWSGVSRQNQGTSAAPPFGPAGNGVIAFAKDGDILVADRPGGDPRPLVAGPEFDQAPMFSPDGTKLAFLRDTDSSLDGSVLMVADADGTNPVQVVPRPGVPGGWMWSFAPDGRSLMGVTRISNGENRVVLIPVDPGAPARILDIRLPVSSEYILESGGPSFRPTNPQEILVAAQLEPDGPYGLYVYDLATGRIRTIVKPAAYVPQDVAWLPDGEHIIYDNNRIVAADGSGGGVGDGRDHISPVSNDGTRVVVDVAEVDLPGDDSHQRSVVVPIHGEGEPVQLACGLGTTIECASSWIWSPDDSILLGTVRHETSHTYLQADPDTGHVTELDWVDLDDFDTPAWQRVAP